MSTSAKCSRPVDLHIRSAKERKRAKPAADELDPRENAVKLPRTLEGLHGVKGGVKLCFIEAEEYNNVPRICQQTTVPNDPSPARQTQEPLSPCDEAHLGAPISPCEATSHIIAVTARIKKNPERRPRVEHKIKRRSKAQIAHIASQLDPPQDLQPRARARRPSEQQNLSAAPSGSMLRGRRLSHTEAADVRDLINKLPDKAKGWWNVIFQRNGTRGQTLSMIEFEKALKYLAMVIDNGDGSQFKAMPTRFGANAPNIVFHRDTPLGRQNMIHKGKDFQNVYSEVFEIMCEILG